MPDKGDEHPQDPHVERVRPKPSEPPQRTRRLVGFLGDSDRPGMRRLYFSPALDHYAEFRSEDALSLTSIPPEQSPFPGHQVTEATLKRDATVDYTHTHTPGPADEFDLDVRLAPGAVTPALPIETRAPFVCATAPCVTIVNTCAENCRITVVELYCRPVTEATCWTPCHPTWFTCATHCAVNTCNTCSTCNTQCGQATCANTCSTCNTQCGQATCANTCSTCVTQCGPAGTKCNCP